MSLGGLQFGVRAADYFGAMYTVAPAEAGHYLFFSTEPIELELQIGNRDDVPHALQLGGVRIDTAFRVTARRIPCTAPDTLDGAEGDRRRGHIPATVRR